MVTRGDKFVLMFLEHLNFNASFFNFILDEFFLYEFEFLYLKNQRRLNQLWVKHQYFMQLVRWNIYCSDSWFWEFQKPLKEEFVDNDNSRTCEAVLVLPPPVCVPQKWVWMNIVSDNPWNSVILLVFKKKVTKHHCGL